VFPVLNIFLFKFKIRELHCFLLFAYKAHLEIFVFWVKVDSFDAFEEINLVLKVRVCIYLVFDSNALIAILIEQFLGQTFIDLSQLFDRVEQKVLTG